MQRQRQRPTHLYLTLALAVYLCLVTLPATQGFMAFDHKNPRTRRKINNLIRRVHKAEWVIGYRYMDNCPPKSRNNGKAIEEAITTSLRAWLKPVRELNTGKPVVDDFRYVPDFEIKDVADRQLYDLTSVFFCDIAKSHAWVLADEAKPPHIELHRGTFVDDQFAFPLLHEIGHAFGLLDTYPRPELTLEELRVSRGGIGRTIGHQPGSVMSGHNAPRPLPTRISQDDANGIVWLYKFYHENLPLEDCVFPDYELEKSPDGCRPKSPLIFEIKHGREDLALEVIHDDKDTDINAKDGDGMTVLHYAIIKGYPKLLDKLLAHQAIEVNSQDEGGLTALHHAVLQGNESAVKALVGHEGIDVDIKDGSGLTALHHAVLEKNQHAVNALLAHEGIDANIKDGSGLTALHHAVMQKNQHAVNTLLAHEGIDANIKDGNGLTALHHAVLQRAPHAVKALLAHEGIDTEVKDEQGRTALELANELEYKEIVQSLAVNPKGKLTTVWGRLKQMD